MSKQNKQDNNVVSFADAQADKVHELKEEKVALMAKRFELAFPTKATPVKDYLKKKRKNKKKK
ncbi:hypothetical protein NBRC116188_11860 [Oceaniserpentilla sp. 4NH20-0058]|uniref:tRNA (uracil-5-)-methyltransferase n=1 Tax=Oceaniserpentilla sp. 4NH20-0058 TaxID=3127660 RepID=UPI0031081123